MKRGEIWWADLPAPRGSEPGFRRPVLVVQSNAFNASRIASIVVVALTSNLAVADAPGNVRVPRKQSKLAKESVANVSQILTLDKRFLVEQVGKVSPTTLESIDNGLRLVLSLS